MRKYQEYRQKMADYEEVHGALEVVEKTAIFKLQRLRDKAPIIKDYAQELKEIIERFSNFYINKSNPLFVKKDYGKRVLFIMAGNKGITGGLYNNLASETISKIKDYDLFYTSSKKLQHYLVEKNIEVELLFPDLCEKYSQDIIDTALNWCIKNFKSGFSKLDFIYQEYIRLTEQKPVVASFFPLDLNFTKTNESNEPLGFPVFEPSKRQIFYNMTEQFIRIYFRSIVLQASLSETAARTLNSHSAVTKTEELINKTHLEFLKARRQIVTQRQLESFIVRESS
jgi:F-type H+-transporting ATPase subunit gamma